MRRKIWMASIAGVAGLATAGAFGLSALSTAGPNKDNPPAFDVAASRSTTQLPVTGCALFSSGCNLAPTQLISVNAINTQNGAAVPVAQNQVRFIMNGGTAQSIFGTPFGNTARNVVQDARTNIGNLAVSKFFKIKERASFEFRATCVNVLNHPQFASVDPFLEDAGNFGVFNGYGNPKVSDTVPGAISFPNSASRRLIFGGVFRF